MLKILVNAYACSPNMGSEPGMAWNWCVNLAKYCELHIITEGEFRDKIEAVLPTLPQGNNMHFYYNPVSNEIRKMCWNQGDWRFYKYYREWQWKTYIMAEEIIKQHDIDIVHQLNMIGFREPGYLWEIENKPFVWGPIGGLKQFPNSYLEGSGIKMKLFNRIKNIVNIYQIKHDKRVNQALKKADLLICSIPDSYNVIKRYKGLNSIIIPETGCFIDDKAIRRNREEKANGDFKLLWVGKFDFRKQLNIALATMAKLKDKSNIKLIICGSGSDDQVSYYKQMALKLDIEDNVVWKGNIENSKVKEEMRKSDIFFFTSVSEDTSTVVLEAVSCELPVLCFDTCGMGYVINESVGQKIPLTNPKQSADDFAEKINYLYNNREYLQNLSDGCKQRQKELSWDNKAKQMVELYNKVINNQ
ncbi:glycosyltransferase family 4 protein [Xylanibacter rarus]|uniref:glycosyltransferase family 4 protein n=1 Tax=Xylanibacter rarus TaxID=1676614 RepID=UPI003AB9B264